jgi:hypothetical protein
VDSTFGRHGSVGQRGQTFTYDLGETNSFALCYELIMARPLRIFYPNAFIMLPVEGMKETISFETIATGISFWSCLDRQWRSSIFGFTATF